MQGFRPPLPSEPAPAPSSSHAAPPAPAPSPAPLPVSHSPLRLVSAPLGQLIQIAVHVLKDHVQAVVLTDDLFEVHDVWVSELLQRLDLVQGNAVVPRVVLALNALHRHLKGLAGGEGKGKGKG